MALIVGLTTVIDDSRNLSNVTSISASGIVTASVYYGSGIGLTNLVSSILPNTTVSVAATNPVTPINFNNGRNVLVGLKTDTVFTFAGISSVGEAVVIVRNDEPTTTVTKAGQVNYTKYKAVWPQNIYWQDGNIPTENSRSVITKYRFFTVNGGTDWYGTLEQVIPGSSVYYYGFDDYGQTGQSFTQSLYSKTWNRIPGPWVQFYTNATSSVGLKTDGRVYSSGYNGYGELGIGDVVSRSAFTQMPFASFNWRHIDLGNNHVVGIRSDGTLWCWGRNDYGQLGDSSAVPKSSPVQVTGGYTNVKAAYASNLWSMAITSNHTIIGWGYNGYGQLGNATANSSNTAPVAVVLPAGNTDWLSISVGDNHVLARRADSNYRSLLYAWGYNVAGQLGFNDVVPRSTATVVSASVTWDAIIAGGNHSVGIQSGGSFWSWGNNQYGQLGLGDAVNRSSPVRIGLLTDWYPSHTTIWDPAIGIGYSAMYPKNIFTLQLDKTTTIKTDGTLWSWGRSVMDTVAGTYTNRSSPVQLNNLNLSFKALGLTQFARNDAIVGITSD